MSQRSKDVKPKVEIIYKLDQKYIDSTKFTLLKYWERFDGFILTDDQKEAFMRLTPAESILRAARTLREKEGYIATEVVEKQRFKDFKTERDDHSNSLNPLLRKWDPPIKYKMVNILGEQTMVVDNE